MRDLVLCLILLWNVSRGCILLRLIFVNIESCLLRIWTSSLSDAPDPLRIASRPVDSIAATIADGAAVNFVSYFPLTI